MDLTPENLARFGYVPEPNGVDKRPQLRALSTNHCPNAHPLYLSMAPPACSPTGLTTWGYCNQCWSNNHVLATWVARVQEAMP